MPEERRHHAIKNRLQNIYGTIRFSWDVISPRFGFWSYRPDSNYLFGKYPEFTALLSKWLQGNRTNNAGDLTRLHCLILNLEQLLEDGIEGDFAELGVYLGNSASVLAHFANKGKRKVFLFDTFSGFDKRDLVGLDSERSQSFSDTSLDKVKEFVGHEDACIYVKGYFPESVTEYVSGRKFAFVHLDCDLYKPMKDAMEFFWDRLNRGGVLLVHDYSSGHWEGAKKVVDEFCKKTGTFVTLFPDKSGSAIMRKA